MDAYTCTVTKLDIRQFDSKKVPSDVTNKILNAARLTGSSTNSQHWRFLLVQGEEKINTLAKGSPYGRWVQSANFAVIVLTDPKVAAHMIDAGRALQSMQIAAWNFGVASGIYTGINEGDLRRDFKIPPEKNISAIVAFGYPAKKITGKKKNRKPLRAVAFLGEYGRALDA